MLGVGLPLGLQDLERVPPPCPAHRDPLAPAAEGCGAGQGAPHRAAGSDPAPVWEAEPLRSSQPGWTSVGAPSSLPARHRGDTQPPGKQTPRGRQREAEGRDSPSYLLRRRLHLLLQAEDELQPPLLSQTATEKRAAIRARGRGHGQGSPRPVQRGRAPGPPPQQGDRSWRGPLPRRPYPEHRCEGHGGRVGPCRAPARQPGPPELRNAESIPVSGGGDGIREPGGPQGKGGGERSNRGTYKETEGKRS